MIKSFHIFEQQSDSYVPSLKEWQKCPRDYQFKIGERVKMSPNSQFKCQAIGNKEGNIAKIGDASTWYVDWDEGSKSCYYWREDLLISKEISEEYRRKREEIRLKHLDIDPYGEDDWMMENADFDDFVQPRPLYKTGDTVYYHGMHRKVHGYYTIKGRFHVIHHDEPEEGDTGWRYYLMSNTEIMSNTQIIDGAWEMSLSPTEKEGKIKDKEYQERKEAKRKKWIDEHPEDPYGEEIWESRKNLYVGDTVIIKDNRHLNQTGIIIDFDSEERIGLRTSRDTFKVQITHHRSHGASKWFWNEYIWVKKENLLKADKKKLKEKEKQEKQIRIKNWQKYKDIDPYGEEDWENESRVFESNTTDINLLKLRGKITNWWGSPLGNYYHPNKNIKEDPEYLILVKKMLLNKIVKFTNYNYSDQSLNCDVVVLLVKEIRFNSSGTLIFDGELMNDVNPRNRTRGIHGNSFAVDERRPITITDGVDLEIILKLIQKEKEEKRLKMIDIDPYGEEEWENESRVNEWFEDFEEEKDEDFKSGDIVVCMNNIGAPILQVGRRYEIVKFDKDIFGGVVTLKELGGKAYFTKDRFRKIRTNESVDHSDIDPYNEEDWTGQEKDEDSPLNWQWVNDDPDPEDNMYGECRLCGRYAPNALMLDDLCQHCREEENKCNMCGSYVPNEFLDNGICKKCLEEPGWDM